MAESSNLARRTNRLAASEAVRLFRECPRAWSRPVPLEKSGMPMPRQLLPKPGTVLCVPVDDWIAFICILRGSCIAVYDLRADKRPAGCGAFTPASWKWYLWFLNLPPDSSEVCKLALNEDLLEPPPVFERIPDDLARAIRCAPLRIYHKGMYSAANEEQTKGMQEFRRVDGESLKAFLRERKHEMRPLEEVTNNQK